jgi:hypothetical protein
MSRFPYIIAVTGCGCFTLGFSSAYYLVDHGGALAVQNEPRHRTYVDSIKISTGGSFAEKAHLAPGTARKFMTEPPPKPEVSEKLVERLLSNRTTEDILPKNTVSDELADCLGMTIQERTTVDEALKTALASFKEEQRKHTKIARTDNDSMTFSIDKFSYPGLAIKECLRNKVNEGLGLDRSVLFMRLTKSAIDDAYLDFGQSDVKIEVNGLSKQTGYGIIVQSGSMSRRFETSSVPELLQGLIEW